MKKTIAMLLALVMLVSCLAACEKAPVETNPPATQPKETEYVAPTQPEAPKEELGKLPLTENGETITIGLPQSALTEDYETNAYTKWLEEQTGLNLDFVYFSSDKEESVTQLNLMIAGNEKLPDILWGMAGVSTALMYELGEDGYILDLKDYFPEYGYWFWEEYNKVKEGDQTKIFQFGTDPNNGEFYAFPRYSEATNDSCNTLTAINAKWLEAVGEEMPTNVDELYTVLKKFATEDPNGNGKLDEMPVVGYEGGYRTDIVSFIINAFVYCCDTNFFNATDGQVWVPYTTDEYRQAMIYLNKLYTEGLLTPMFYTITEKAELTALMTPADGTAIAGVAGAHPSLHYETNNELLYEYAALAPLEGATELGGYAPFRGNTFEYNTFITADCEHPELAFKLLDFMTSQESYLRMRYGVYGEDWEFCGEGKFASTGLPATVTVLNSAAYSEQNNRCWHYVGATIMSNGNWSTAWSDDGSWTAKKSVLAADCYQNYLNGQRPAEVIQKLVYNAEELSFVSSVETQIKDYVAEARAMFVSGVMNPNDDAAWNTYLANLETQGLDQFIETAQSAYTRMNAE